jgi:hypothetical protein
MWLSGFHQFTTIRPDLFQRPEVEPFGLPGIIRRQALTRPAGQRRPHDPRMLAGAASWKS